MPRQLGELFPLGVCEMYHDERAGVDRVEWRTGRRWRGRRQVRRNESLSHSHVVPIHHDNVIIPVLRVCFSRGL